MRASLTVALLLLALTGCGQKGSLYFGEPVVPTGDSAANPEASNTDKDNPAPQDP